MADETSERRNGTANRGRDLLFVPVQTPSCAADPSLKSTARAHAVKHGLRRKRSLQRASADNFINLAGRTAAPCSALAPTSAYTPFETVFGDLPRLQALLDRDAPQQAAEPVFSIPNPVVFQDFDSVFRTDRDDPALVNAVRLTFAFAMTGGNIDRECLEYQTHAMSILRDRVERPDNALTLPTLGAILLLAGVEARLGMRWQVQLHMNAIRTLLDTCQDKPIYMTDGIKRAIFWQDLNSSILTGSDRIVDHTTFAELQWIRDPFVPSFFVVPQGFSEHADRYPPDFIEVLKDIHALQCVQDLPRYSCQNATEMLRVDNQQASIGSRLLDLPKLTCFLEACYLAAYLSACMLCCKVWRHSIIPANVSLHLLRTLMKSTDEVVWEATPALLVWMLYLGGSSSPQGPQRTEYKALLKGEHACNAVKRYVSWSLEDLVDVFKRFVWSEKAYRSQFQKFWMEFHAE